MKREMLLMLSLLAGLAQTAHAERVSYYMNQTNIDSGIHYRWHQLRFADDRR